jgi:hypothetical protein
MRENLAKYHGQKITVAGYFDRFVTVTYQGKPVTTALFRSVRLADTGEPLADHNHINNARSLTGHNIQRGECVHFDAVVLDYLKTDQKSGFKDVEYGLYHPTKIRLVDRELEPVEPEEFGSGVFDD